MTKTRIYGMLRESTGHQASVIQKLKKQSNIKKIMNVLNVKDFITIVIVVIVMMTQVL